MKLVISDPKTGKSFQKELDKEMSAFLKEKKIGDELEGALMELSGYSFEITGGSDRSGFPMRSDIPGARKIRAFLSSGTGYNPKRKGERKKKMVAGNTVSDEIVQLNLKVKKYGDKTLDDLLGKKEEKKEGA